MARGHIYRRTLRDGTPSRWYAVIDSRIDNGTRKQITKSIESISEMVHHLNRAQKEQTKGSELVMGAVEQIKRVSHQFQGLTASTYSRSEGWEFIQFGKYIERADKTTRIMDVKYHILLPSGAGA